MQCCLFRQARAEMMRSLVFSLTVFSVHALCCMKNTRRTACCCTRSVHTCVYKSASLGLDFSFACAGRHRPGTCRCCERARRVAGWRSKVQWHTVLVPVSWYFRWRRKLSIFEKTWRHSGQRVLLRASRRLCRCCWARVPFCRCRRQASGFERFAMVMLLKRKLIGRREG